MREKIYEERCEQKDILKTIKKVQITNNSSEYALMNSHAKSKITNLSSQIESFNKLSDSSNQDNFYIEKIKSELKIKSLKKMIKDKSKLMLY